MKTDPAFSVVLVYDKYSDGIRAKEFFDRLVFNHGELFHFICHLWKFDVLREPQLFEAATRDALGADMIVFVTRQSQELPVEAIRWIDHWLPSKQADSGALVLLPGDPTREAGETTTVCATLKQITESANVRVFCRETAWPAMDSHLAVQITNPVSGGTAELINALVRRSPTQSLTKV
ncbi:MAG: hypothetical protein IH623_17185 [Verrucomicrobia bacterium]|nr:hypothetical protein [Verrucomicrobiota bacterium]